MYILDTDHMSILDRGREPARKLLTKLAGVAPSLVATTIVTYEEQTRGWLSYIAKASSLSAQIIAYRKLEKHITNYRMIPIMGFDERAGQMFQELRKNYPRLGSMDLKIAAITVTNNAVLLTRNLLDFGQIANLKVEDWIS